MFTRTNEFTIYRVPCWLVPISMFVLTLDWELFFFLFFYRNVKNNAPRGKKHDTANGSGLTKIFCTAEVDSREDVE